MRHIMQQELRFATFNVLNLALPGVRFYSDQEPYTQAQYDAKTLWIAQQLDALDADVIGFQEIFSQAALADVLSKTHKYRHAHQVGFDPEVEIDIASSVAAGTYTPSVALVSRLPLAGLVAHHHKLPHGLSVPVPGADHPATAFTRAVLHVQLVAESTKPAPVGAEPKMQLIDVFVCHLKSKRPDYRGVSHDVENDSYQLGLAMLRSMVRRGAEALGLRYLISDQLRRQRLPLIILGDFNDVSTAMTTQLVTGAVSERRMHRDRPTDRLFDSYRIQSHNRPVRDVAYTHIYDGVMETIDHVLVSDAFEPGAPASIGEVLEVAYINDHLGLKRHEASDHGQVLVRVMLFGTTNGA
jgi:endonuclease/exonuclease/phosphatase family metal-dependent hydrolase